MALVQLTDFAGTDQMEASLLEFSRQLMVVSIQLLFSIISPMLVFQLVSAYLRRKSVLMFSFWLGLVKRA